MNRRRRPESAGIKTAADADGSPLNKTMPAFHAGVVKDGAPATTVEHDAQRAPVSTYALCIYTRIFVFASRLVLPCRKTAGSRTSF